MPRATDQTPAGGVPPATRRLLGELAGLGQPAVPDGLTARILGRVGLGSDLSYFWLDTDLGRLYLAYGPNGLLAVAPAATAADFEAWCAARLGQRPRPAATPPRELVEQSRAVLAGRLPAGALPLDLGRLGAFERAVLVKALEIPRGELRTYGWVAREIGRPRAVRAVGRALGRNPIPFIIPCHRVVASSGSLTGYAFGVPLKRRVLLSEGLDPALLARVERGVERYRGSRLSGRFCFTTCRHARQLPPESAVPLRDEAAALAAGFRPCPDCRPVALSA